MNGDTIRDVDDESLTWLNAQHELGKVSLPSSLIQSSDLENLRNLFFSIKGEIGNNLRNLLPRSIKFIPDLSSCFPREVDHVPSSYFTDFENELEQDLIPELTSALTSEDASVVENLLKFGLHAFIRILLTLPLSKPLKYKILELVHTINIHYCSSSSSIFTFDLLRHSLGLSKVLLSILISSQCVNDTRLLAKKILVHWCQVYGSPSEEISSETLIVRLLQDSSTPNSSSFEPTSAACIVMNENSDEKKRKRFTRSGCIKSKTLKTQ